MSRPLFLLVLGVVTAFSSLNQVDAQLFRNRNNNYNYACQPNYRRTFFRQDYFLTRRTPAGYYQRAPMMNYRRAQNSQANSRQVQQPQMNPGYQYAASPVYRPPVRSLNSQNRFRRAPLVPSPAGQPTAAGSERTAQSAIVGPTTVQPATFDEPVPQPAPPRITPERNEETVPVPAPIVEPPATSILDDGS